MAWTTEDVRRWFIIAAPVDDARGEFDAWLAAHDAEVARAAAERGWDEGKSAAVNSHPSWWRTLVNPHRKPEHPVSAEVLAAMPGVPPFPTIRKEDFNG